MTVKKENGIKILLSIITILITIVIAIVGVVYSTVDKRIEKNTVDIGSIESHLVSIDSTLVVGQLIDSMGTVAILHRLDEIQEKLK